MGWSKTPLPTPQPADWKGTDLPGQRYFISEMDQLLIIDDDLVLIEDQSKENNNDSGWTEVSLPTAGWTEVDTPED